MATLVCYGTWLTATYRAAIGAFASPPVRVAPVPLSACAGNRGHLHSSSMLRDRSLLKRGVGILLKFEIFPKSLWCENCSI